MAKTSLQDRVIVITGASSGIGAATAVACAEAGMHVVLGARRLDKLQAVADQVRAKGRQAIALACDVRKDQDVQALVDEAVHRFGRLDAAFANAGYGLFASVLQTTDEQSRQMFDTNYYGTLRLARSAAKVMIEQGHGHILICSSAASEIGLPMYGLYCATKAAQDAIAGALRAEVARHGVRVSSVHPIGTSSAFFDVVQEQSNHPGFRLNTPAPLRQTPRHVADRIVRCLRRPTAEVWPSRVTRFALALATAMPGLTAWYIARNLRPSRKSPRK